VTKVFTIKYQDHYTQARVGQIQTNHGLIETPTFVPDATYGAVKHLSSQDLKKMGLQMILGNIYHLGLRPGIPAIKKLSGLHQFMNWDQPIITDSGGFQVFSLVYKNKMGKIVESGIHFQDHLSGKLHFLSPKKSINDQLAIGTDLLMCLDYPIHPSDLSNENKISVRLTTKWAKECYQVYKSLLNKLPHQHAANQPILMAIIQGANSKLMRKTSFNQLEKICSWPGYGFGGLPLNEQILQYTAKLIPSDRIRYVMGTGTPYNILKAVAMGWDLFDCVIPTRNARHGLLYTFQGELRLTQAKYALDKKPIEKDCFCEGCLNYSRAYIRHLLKVGEPLGQRLATLHNLTFYVKLMKKIRQSIKTNTFQKLLNSLQYNL